MMKRSMKLGDLLADLFIVNEVDKNIEITGISIDNRDVKHGDLFIFHKGEKFDSHSCYKSIEDKAQAFISEINLDTDLPQFRIEDTNDLIGLIAARFYGHPTEAMTNIAVTGTNGKTSVIKLISHLLRPTNKLIADIGTNGIFLNDIEIETNTKTPTTPPPLELQEIAYELKNKNSDYLLMEVTSHGLHMGRTLGIGFKYRLFTNLTKDHLDYHQTMEAYLKAKKILFDTANPSDFAIINADSKYAKKIVKDTQAQIITYALDVPADFRAINIEENELNTRFDLIYKDETIPFETELIGRYNVSNLLASIIVAYKEGLPWDAIQGAVNSFHGIKGRLQRVETSNVFIDYAHTPDALENVLQTVKNVATGKVIVVFGAGGDRDKTKRPEMGIIAEENSHIPIVTSDNPRTEDPSAIIADILQGMKEKTLAIINRKDAIEQAIKLAEPDDVIIIAGKGQEEYQEINGVRHDFSDYEVAKSFL